MLYRLGFQNRSAIETLIEKEGTTLENVLDEDDILQEVKAHNSKLIEYLNKKERLIKLIQMVTIEIKMSELEIQNNDENLEKRVKKYPHIAAEILSSDLDSICYTIASDDDLMNTLFLFLSTTTPQNSILCSYWIRVVTNLLNRKPSDICKFILKQDQSFANNLIDHIGVSGMDELLLKLMAIDFSEPSDNGTLNPFQHAIRMRLLEKKKRESSSAYDVNEIGKWWLQNHITTILLEKLDAKYDLDTHTNVTQVLSEIVRRSNYTRATFHSELHPIAQYLLSQHVVEQLMDKVFNHPESSVLQQGVTLLSVLMQTATESNNGEVVFVICSNISRLIKILENPPSVSPISLSFGELQVPLGETRLKVIEFISNLFKIASQDSTVQKLLIESKVLALIVDLFFQYEFNNLLHNIFLRIVSFIVPCDSVELKKHLFVDCKLMSKIVEANKLNEQAIAKPKGMRKGYMGHLTIISNTIVATASSQPFLLDLVQQVEGWKEFVDTTLFQRNVLEGRASSQGNTNGNGSPSHGSDSMLVNNMHMSQDEEDSDDSDSDDDDLYIHYQKDEDEEEEEEEEEEEDISTRNISQQLNSLHVEEQDSDSDDEEQDRIVYDASKMNQFNKPTPINNSNNNQILHDDDSDSDDDDDSLSDEEESTVPIETAQRTEQETTSQDEEIDLGKDSTSSTSTAEEQTNNL